MSTFPKIASRPRLVLMISVVVLGLIQALSLIGLAWMTQQLLDAVLEGTTGLQSMLLPGLISLMLLSALCRWFERVVAERLGNNYVHEVRLKIFDVLTQPTTGGSSLTPDRQQGVHMVRFSNDLSALRQWVSMGLARLISANLFLVGVFIALAIMDAFIAAVVALVVALSLIFIGLIGIGLERSVRNTRRKRGQLANTVADVVSNLRHLAAYGRTPRERKRLSRKSEALGDALTRRAFWIGGLRGVTDFSHRSIMLVALVVGFIGIQAQQFTVSTLLAVLGVTALVGAPLRDLGRVFEYWKNSQVAREKIGVLFNTDGNPVIKTRRLAGGDGRLSLRKVKLGELIHIDRLTVPVGRRIALVGDNGVGKSTLLKMIAGLIAPDSGRIRLDSVDTLQLSHIDRRRSIGIASHQVPLMPGSISKNIRYRKPQASADEFDLACSQAGIYDNVVNLPNGLKTRLGAVGCGMSDGETARVKLARALLGRPRLLLFDEIEAGLDQQGRRLVYALLDSYPGTIIYATHDDALIHKADRVWHLRDGRLRSNKPTIITQEQTSA